MNGGTLVIPKKIHYCWFGGGEKPVRLCQTDGTTRPVNTDILLPPLYTAIEKLLF